MRCLSFRGTLRRYCRQANDAALCFTQALRVVSVTLHGVWCTLHGVGARCMVSVARCMVSVARCMVSVARCMVSVAGTDTDQAARVSVSVFAMAVDERLSMIDEKKRQLGELRSVVNGPTVVPVAPLLWYPAWSAAHYWRSTLVAPSTLGRP